MPRFATGSGISDGMVSMHFWRYTVIPLLIDRAAAARARSWNSRDCPATADRHRTSVRSVSGKIGCSRLSSWTSRCPSTPALVWEAPRERRMIKRPDADPLICPDRPST